MIEKPIFQELTQYNNTTGNKPIRYEVVLLLPFFKELMEEEPELTFKILDAPAAAKVAGYQYKHIRVPDYDRYSKTYRLSELSKHEIKPQNHNISQNKFTYRTKYSNLETELDYYEDVKYYDLSMEELEVEGLPHGQYIIEWQIQHRELVVDYNIDEIPYLVCYKNQFSYSAIRQLIEHPGMILDAMLSNTPALYHNEYLSDFYRPFAEVLNDLKKQEDLLYSINFVDFMPTYYIKYLAYFIGWDLLPVYESDDKLKRAIIKNAWRLKQYKGSQKTIEDLLNIFGYISNIIKLNYDKKGKLQRVKKENLIKREILYNNEKNSGFQKTEIPLLSQPNEYITLIGYRLRIEQDEPETGFLSNYTKTNNTIIDDYSPDYLSKHTITIKLRTGEIEYEDYEERKLIKFIKYNKYRNTLILYSDHYYKNYNILWYTNYEAIIESIENNDLRSNKFDVKISTKSGDQINTLILDYIIKYIVNLKPFHSILRKVLIDVLIDDVYLVTDMCMGDYLSEPNTDFGEVQINPAIIPTDDPCLDITRGFKPLDIKNRHKLLRLLQEEREAHNIEVDNHPIDKSLQPFSNVEIKLGTKDSGNCFRGRVSEEVSRDINSVPKDAYYNISCEFGYGGGEYDVNWIKNPSNKFITIDTIHTYGIQNYRSPTYGKLKNTYISSEYKWTPWDNEDECFVPEVIKTTNHTTLHQDNDIINPEVLEILTRYEELIYEDKPYEVEGNGLDEDIPTFGSDHGIAETAHNVYTTTEVMPYDDDLGLDNTYTSSQCIAPDRKIFNTLNRFETPTTECIDESGTEYVGVDYSDGYPSEKNEFQYSTDFDQLVIPGIRIEDLPWNPTEEPEELRFKFGSEMYDLNAPIGIRFGCGEIYNQEDYMDGIDEFLIKTSEEEEADLVPTISLYESEHCSHQYNGRITYGDIDIIKYGVQDKDGNYIVNREFVDAYGNVTKINLKTDLIEYEATVKLYNKKYIEDGYKELYKVYRKGIIETDKWHYVDNGFKITADERYLETHNNAIIDITETDVDTYEHVRDLELISYEHDEEYDQYIEDKHEQSVIIPNKFDNFVTEEVSIIIRTV